MNVKVRIKRIIDKYDGSWPVSEGYDDSLVNQKTAEKITPYIVGWANLPVFKFDNRIGTLISRACKSDVLDEALDECVNEFKKHQNQIVFHSITEIRAVDPDTLRPQTAYKVRYSVLPSHEEVLAPEIRFTKNEN